MSLILGLEPFQKLGVGGGDVGWWWSKGILELRLGPNLGLRPEAWTKLNNNHTILKDWRQENIAIIILIFFTYKVEVGSRNAQTLRWMKFLTDSRILRIDY